MKWFGRSWGAPVCTDVEHEETPEGQECFLCQRVIEEGDQGLIMPFSGGPRDPDELPCHHLCLMDAIIPPPESRRP